MCYRIKVDLSLQGQSSSFDSRSAPYALSVGHRPLDWVAVQIHLYQYDYVTADFVSSPLQLVSNIYHSFCVSIASRVASLYREYLDVPYDSHLSEYRKGSPHSIVTADLCPDLIGFELQRPLSRKVAIKAGALRLTAVSKSCLRLSTLGLLHREGES